MKTSVIKPSEIRKEIYFEGIQLNINPNFGKLPFKSKTPNQLVEKLAQIKQMKEHGLNDKEIASYFNLDENTFHRFFDKNPELRRLKHVWKKNTEILAKRNIHEAIKEKKDLNTSKWYLEKTSKEFNPIQKTQSLKLSITSSELQKLLNENTPESKEKIRAIENEILKTVKN